MTASFELAFALVNIILARLFSASHQIVFLSFLDLWLKSSCGFNMVLYGRDVGVVGKHFLSSLIHYGFVACTIHVGVNCEAPQIPLAAAHLYRVASK